MVNWPALAIFGTSFCIKERAPDPRHRSTTMTLRTRRLLAAAAFAMIHWRVRKLGPGNPASTGDGMPAAAGVHHPLEAGAELRAVHEQGPGETVGNPGRRGAER